MRLATLVALALLCCSATVNAQPAPYRAVVTDLEVKLYAGPSGRYAETGTLTRGSIVIVEHEEAGGWLAITAPYGSVSWIATQFIEDPAPDQPTPKNVQVYTEGEVTLAAGKAGLQQPLDIRRVKVPNGTGLLLLGPKVTFAGKTWYPVAPPAGDFRYLPKTAVQFDRPANTNFTVRVTDRTGELPPASPSPPAVGPAASISAPSAIAPAAGGTTAGKPAVNHPLWAQAEAAEREGRLDDAERLFFELARLMNSPGGDHDIANFCYSRIHQIRDNRRNAGRTPPGGTLQPPTKDERPIRPGTPTALPAGLPAAGPTAGPATGPAAGTGAENGPQWAGPGILRRSALTLDGRNAYALESSPGVVRFYVVAMQGVNLEKYVAKRVDVYGVVYERSGLSKPYIAASAVEPR